MSNLLFPFHSSGQLVAACPNSHDADNGSSITRHSNCERKQPLLQWIGRVLAVLLLLVSSGCSTLSSLGLSFGNTENRMLQSTKQMLEQQNDVVQFPKELEMQPLGTYLVEIGDTLFIETVNFDASIRLPGDQIVKPDGTISLGQFGNIYVASMTVEQIESAVQARIAAQIRSEIENASANGVVDDFARLSGITVKELAEQGQYAGSGMQDQEDKALLEKRIAEAIRANRVSVRLINWESKRYYVLGEVNSPGAFPYSGHETVLDGILEAGGLNAGANRHQIIISRPTDCGSCKIVARVCYDQIVQHGDASTNYQLQPGDRIFVASLTLCEDIAQSLNIFNNHQCPRCAAPPQACQLPEGCCR